MAAEIRVLKSGFNEQAVDMLENLLDQARKGELVELVATYKVRSSPEAYFAWTGCNDITRLIGDLEAVKHRMVQRMLKG